LIWLKACKAAGLGFLAMFVLGFLYGIGVAVVGGRLQLSFFWVILVISYLFTGFIAARRSSDPYTTGGLAGFILMLINLLLTRLLFGGVFQVGVVPIGMVLIFLISLLGVGLYLIWSRIQNQKASIGGGQDETMER
jgi:hypothetical protein